MKQKSIVAGALRTLFRTWVISVGLIALVLGISYLVNKTIMPFVLLVLAYFISALMRVRGMQNRQVCMRIAWVVRTTFVISAFVMFTLLLSHVESLFGTRFNAPYFNPQIPYVTGLVVLTVCSVVCIYALFMGVSLGVCRACRRMYGEYENDSLASSLFNDESERQLRLLLWMCIGMGTTQWAYFLTFFINVNFNSPDKFFFNFLPVAVYLLSLIFLASRYYSITEAFQSSASASTRINGNNELRFLVTSGDNMLLREQGDGEWDTPYRAEIPSQSKADDDKARQRFEAMGGPADASIRYLYTNRTSGGSVMLHYAVFVPDESKEKALRGGKWCSLYEVDGLLNGNRLSPMLANELVRIHTITMAWKTYDRRGHRLYPIKNYKPIFRLRDFKEWDVDFNDPVWLQISVENEDRPFFRVRRVWRKFLDIFNR